MRTKANWTYVIIIGLMLIGAQAFVPVDVRAQDTKKLYESDDGLVDDGTVAGDPEDVANLTLDLVTPCRIVDTRNAGGIFSPGETRQYYVDLCDVVGQGGNPGCCFAPRDEPFGDFVNVTASPFVGKGNFVLWPVGVGEPNASTINYNAANDQNIANGVAAECRNDNQGGIREINVKNRGGFSHLILDVYGYYDNE
jgi:hypothetical protein